MNKKLHADQDYPLYEKRPELVKTPTGKHVDEITMEQVLKGNITADDCRISGEILEYQAQIAESAGNWQIAENFRRAAELTKVPDERILEIYNALRPNTSTKEVLVAIADELEEIYQAEKNAAYIRETIEVYEDRDILLKD